MNGGLRPKAMEWMRRYLPNELAGWATELGAAGVVYWASGSMALAVVAGTAGSSVGYYGTAYANAVRWSWGELADRPRPVRDVVAAYRGARSIAIEFGPAEAVDSLLIRPVAMYTGPQILGNVVIGWIVGSVLADIAFYVVTICTYERFKGLLAVRTDSTAEEELPGGHDTAVAAASTSAIT